jgi:hypothetical protein
MTTMLSGNRSAAWYGLLDVQLPPVSSLDLQKRLERRPLATITAMRLI